MIVIGQSIFVTISCYNCRKSFPIWIYTNYRIDICERKSFNAFLLINTSGDLKSVGEERLFWQVFFFHYQLIWFGGQFCHQIVSASSRSQLRRIELWFSLPSSALITTELTNDSNIIQMLHWCIIYLQLLIKKERCWVKTLIAPLLIFHFFLTAQNQWYYCHICWCGRDFFSAKKTTQVINQIVNITKGNSKKIK
jgi:hypothetical protein